jgi:AcrR family transcriptional regulator
MRIRSSNAHSIPLQLVSTRPTRPAMRERYDRRRAEVVLGAAQVFAERGYDQTSVPELAEALGLAAGSLYHYFGSKEQLLRAICDQLMDPLLERAEALLEEPREPAEQLRALVRLWVEHVVAHRAHMLVFQQERHVIERGAAWRGVRASRKAFERLAEEALARVDVAPAHPASDVRLVLSALLGMVNHTAQWYRPRGRLSATAIADGYVDLLLGSPAR